MIAERLRVADERALAVSAVFDNIIRRELRPAWHEFLCHTVCLT